MNSHEKIISFTKLIAIFLFVVGTLTLVYCYIGNSGSIVGIGIGVEVGAISIVLISMFFVATEEMVETTIKGIEVTSDKNERSHLYVVKKS